MSQNILEEMVAETRAAVQERKKQVPIGGLRALASMQSRPIDLSSVLRESDGVSLIVHIKHTSPNMGNPVANYDPVMLAKRFEIAGARGLFVATNEKFYQGSLPDLVLVTQNRVLPIIRYDVIEEEYQIVEARAAGADGVLLIAKLLSPDQLRDLISIAQRNRMTAVVQVQTEDEVNTAIRFDPRVIFINNRDMRDYSVDLDRTVRLRKLVPPHIAVASGGGLRTAEDVAHVCQVGIDCIIVGQALLTAPDPNQAIKELFRLTATS